MDNDEIGTKIEHQSMFKVSCSRTTFSFINYSHRPTCVFFVKSSFSYIKIEHPMGLTRLDQDME